MHQPKGTRRGWANAGWAGGVLGLLLAVLFWPSVDPRYVLFANDGPLGVNASAVFALPQSFLSCWHDLNWLGTSLASVSVNITSVLAWWLGPVGFAKFYVPLVLLLLGLSAWYFFSSHRFSTMTAVIGGIMVMLNSQFFSQACWGLATHCVTLASSFTAMALLAGRDKRWVRLALAGLAVGLGVAEGSDVGALFSMAVASWIVYQAWVESKSGDKSWLAAAAARLVVVVLFSALLAAQTVVNLVGTQIHGIAGSEQDLQTKAQRWDWATQWSLPKQEVLSLAIPGLFGYRMDTPDGGQYWGKVGRTPGWEEHKQGFPRFVGSGWYAGVPVLLLAALAFGKSFRRRMSVFSQSEIRYIWFWSGAATFSLLLAFGRFAPVYYWIYQLPYFSTIRNPVKFMFFVEWSLVILAAFGLEGLWRLHFNSGNGGSAQADARLGSELGRQWKVWFGLIAALSAVGCLVYINSRPALERFLRTDGFGAPEAGIIARHSTNQTGWFLFFLGVGGGLIWMILNNKLTGVWKQRGFILLGIVIALDLGRANFPWIVYWDYPNKYATNPVIDLLRDQPHRHRVAIAPSWMPRAFGLPPDVVQQEQYLGQLYRIEWAQHQFQFHNIQSLDVVQMSREPVDYKAFEGALQFVGSPETLHRVTRRWELTNTRYLLGPSVLLELLNGQLDQNKQRFRITHQFDIIPKPNITQPSRLEDLTATLATNGPYAVFEFTGALDRAKLFSQWQVATNEQTALQTLARADFDPAQSVLVSAAPPQPPISGSPAGNVEFMSYSPRQIVLKADAKSPSILLLNDRFDPGWTVSVDGKPAELLRCNFLMRGVYLESGQHTVVFKFQPSVRSLWVTLAAMGLGVGLAGILVHNRFRPVPAANSQD